MKRTLTIWMFLVLIPPARAATPPVATYESVQDLKGYYHLAFQPWSPDGRLLAVISPKGQLCIWDSADPGKPPRVVARKGNELSRWSPDGGWLLTQAYNRDVSPCLVAVRISDAHADTLSLVGVGPFFWASDGKIYDWEGEQPLQHRIVAEPPKLWASEHPGSHPAKAVLFSSFGFLPGPKPREWDLAVTREQPGTPLLLYNAFPGDSLYLAALCIQKPVHTVNCVINLKGEVVRELSGPDRVDWMSVSADGKYLLGALELRTPLVNGHPHTILYVADSHGESSMPVGDAPEGTGTRWATRGYLFCAQDYINGVLHVGRIRFSRAGTAR